MAEFIIQTRITPPKLSSVVHRHRLFSLLDSNVDKSLILVSSPAGYGKTTLVRDYLEEKNLKFSWLNCAVDMDNFFTFMSYLVYSIQKLDSNFGKNTLQIIESLKLKERKGNIKEDCVLLTGTMVNEFSEIFKNDITIVIDDLHNIDSDKNKEWLKEIFSFLFENIPDNIHVIIISREIQLFSIAKLAAKRKMYEILLGTLSFTEDEVRELLNEIYSISSRPEYLTYLMKNFNGWITGLHLVLQAFGEKFINFAISEDKLPEDIFNFFAEEIFTRLDNDIQNFLLNTALFDSFNPEICDSILNINNSKNLIELLITKNIFIQQFYSSVNVQSGTLYYDNYIYLSLFHSFLLAKVNRIKTSEEIELMYRKISSYFQEKADNSASISYSLRGKDFKNAIKKILSIEKQLFEEGNYETLWKWLCIIPEDIMVSNPHLSFIKGKTVRSLKGDLEESLLYINNAISKFDTDSDSDSLIECKIYGAHILYLLGSRDESFNMLLALLNSDTNPENKSSLYLAIGRVYFSNGQHEEAVKYLNKSLEIAEKEKFKKIQNNIFRIMASIYVIEGEFIKSLFYFEQITDEFMDVYSKGSVLSNMIFLNSYMGNYEKAKEYMDISYKMHETFPQKHVELGNYYTEAKFRNIAGDYERSLPLLEKAISLANRTNRKYYLSYCYELLLENYYYLNKTDAARQILETYIAHSGNTGDDDTYKTFDAILRKKSETGKNIEKALMDSLEFRFSKKLRSETAQSNFHLADYYFKTGEKDKAAEFLFKSLQTASEYEYISMFENKIFDFRDLLELAMTNITYNIFLKDIVQRVIRKSQFTWLSDDCRNRLALKIENFYDINMISFGDNEFKIQGEIVSENKWKRKVSKLILAYLILNPGIKINKDKITDIFFSELPMEKAEPLLHNAITNIRNVLKSSGSNKQYLIYEGSVLRLDTDYFYKSDAGEFKRYYGLISSGKVDNELKKKYISNAINLYKGELLPGCDYPWCKEMREDFANKYNELFTLLKTYH